MGRVLVLILVFKILLRQYCVCLYPRDFKNMAGTFQH